MTKLPPTDDGLDLAYKLTFDTAGEYPYYCILHAGGPDDEHGMVGTITVS